MLKFLSLMLIIPILFCSKIEVQADLFEGAKAIEIYDNGQLVSMSKTEFDEFENLFCQTICDAVQVPALSIALDNETKEELNSGIWLKFIFNDTHVKSEMPFDELLIKLEPSSQGFNIIRGNDGIYEGRCLYLELADTTEKLYEFVRSVSMQNKNEIEVELESQEIKETTIVSEEETDNDKNKNRKNSVIDINSSPDQKDKEEVLSSMTEENNEIENIKENEQFQGKSEIEESGKSQKELLELLNAIGS